jgi:hypothetical protein
MPRAGKNKFLGSINILQNELEKKNKIISQLATLTKKPVDNTEEDTADITYDANIVIDAAKDKEEFKNEIQNKMTDELTKAEERLIEKLRLKILDELKLEGETKRATKQKQLEEKRAAKQKALEEKRAAKQKELQEQREKDKQYYENLIKTQVYETSKKAELYKKIDDIKQGRRQQYAY